MLVRKVLHTPTLCTVSSIEPSISNLPAFQVPSSGRPVSLRRNHHSPELRRKETMRFNNSVYPELLRPFRRCATRPRPPSRKRRSPRAQGRPARLRPDRHGKTAAFALPILHRLAARPDRPGGGRPFAHPHPTRSWPSRSGQFRRLRRTPDAHAVIYGGVSQNPEQALQKGSTSSSPRGASLD